jgi:hypothetical protein
MIFVDLIRTAHQRGWCTDSKCTTCRAQEFRSAVSTMAGTDGWSLADDLASTPTNALAAEHNADSALQIAFQYLPWPGQHEKVFDAWADDIQDIRLADVLFFRIFGRLPFRESLAPRWVKRCIELAVRSRDESLTETLLWKAPKRRLTPEFMAIAHSLAASSSKIAQALREGGHE